MILRNKQCKHTGLIRDLLCDKAPVTFFSTDAILLPIALYVMHYSFPISQKQL